MKKETNKKIVLLREKTFLAVIEKSVGSAMFQNLYAEVDGEVIDITDGGDISCAFYVSSILLMFGLIKEGHATVSGLVKELENGDWKELPKPKRGSVIVWKEREDDKGDLHSHIGFYVGNEEAVSSRPESKLVTKHHFTYGEEGGKPKRKIVKIFTFTNFAH